MKYVMAEIVRLANNFSIYTAKDEALDVAANLFQYYRKQGTYSVVEAILSGLSGLIIPAGIIASDGTNEWKSLNTVHIIDEVAKVEFQSLMLLLDLL